jgi:hypothetical protein
MSGKVIGVNVTNITVDSAVANWTAMTGAWQYEFKWDLTSDSFGSKTMSQDVGTTPSKTPPPATTYKMTDLKDNTQYSVKVRVKGHQPFQSRWSDAVAFTTLQTVASPTLMVPANGELNMPLNPTFDWSDVTGAVSYEFELGTAPDFAGATAATPKVSQLTWASALTNDTDYYWRVRAVGSTGAKGAWQMSTFHTRQAAITPTTTVTSQTLTVSIPPATTTVVTVSIPAAVTTSVVIPPATTITNTITSQTVTAVVQLPSQAAPAYVWAIVAIGALLTLAVVILIIRTRRVV